MEYTVFKLAFKSPLHIGSNRPGFEHTERYIHSDTLFSALIQSWMMLFPHDMERFFPTQAGTGLNFPYFRISSAFPWVHRQYFFPRPYWTVAHHRTGMLSSSIAKRLKQLTWIEKALLEKWLNGQPPEFHSEETFGNGIFWSPGRKDESGQQFVPVRTVDNVRIRQNRQNNKATPFYFTRLHFADQAGLFFLAQFQNEEWEEKFIAALHLLGDEGLGGDRNVGHGQFIVQEKSTLNIDHPTESSFSLLLSLVHPGPGETQTLGASSSYRFINRKGWVTSGYGRPYRRRAVRMWTEGSVLEGWQGKGDLVNVLEANSVPDLNHPVYRYGHAFALPFHPVERNSHA